ncbi:DUF4306 domain-containing protein [Oceanobacillus zhaokaii]|nr:DUF4306 domain-containing protein [Oceanobacillus zhaokaii]
MFIFWLQVGLAITIFLLSTLAALYEGSGIFYHIFEWEYSTPFSKLINGEVTNAGDIVVLDHFVFAAKYSPTFPIIMTLCGIYLLVLIGYFIFRKSRRFIRYTFILGILLFLLSSSLINAHTIGGKSFFFTFLVSGSMCLIIPLIIYIVLLFKNKTHKGLS